MINKNDWDFFFYFIFNVFIRKQQHVALHCGHLSLTTTKDKEDITSKGVTLIFNGNVRGIKLILQQQEITSNPITHPLTHLLFNKICLHLMALLLIF